MQKTTADQIGAADMLDQTLRFFEMKHMETIRQSQKYLAAIRSARKEATAMRKRPMTEHEAAVAFSAIIDRVTPKVSGDVTAAAAAKGE